MTRFFYYGRKAAAVPDLREYMDIVASLETCHPVGHSGMCRFRRVSIIQRSAVCFYLQLIMRSDEQTGQSKRVRQGTSRNHFYGK